MLEYPNLEDMFSGYCGYIKLCIHNVIRYDVQNILVI